MTKTKLILCGIVAVLLLLAPPAAQADPAIVIKPNGEPCGMPGADEDGNIIFGGFGVVTTKVENGNKVLLKCKGEGITNLSGRAQKFKGFACGIQLPSGGFVVTTDSHAVVSASGIGTLTCTYKKP